MTDVSRQHDLPGSPEAVAAIIADLPRWPEWFALHKGWIGEVPPQAAVGERFKHKVRVLGVPADVTWEVTVVDPPRRAGGPAGGVERAQLTAVAAEGNHRHVHTAHSPRRVRQSGRTSAVTW